MFVKAMNNNLNGPFFKLLRLGIGSEIYKDFPDLSNDEWNRICFFAKKQAVIGILTDGIECLPSEKRPERAIMLKLIDLCLKIEKTNKKLNSKAAEMSQHYMNSGFTPILLKGQGVATMYPRPEKRMPGDIDLWLPERRKKVTEFVKKEYPEAKALYMHIEVKPEEGVTLEIHNVPALMYNPFAYRKLRKMMNRWKDMATELELPDGAGKVLVPCYEMNRVYMLAHKFRHLFTEGIGLRQMMDYMMLLRKGFTEEEKDNTVIKLKGLHLDVFCKAVMHVLTEYLGMEKKFCLMEPDKGAGERLLDIIIEGGNFGKFNVERISEKNKKRSLLGKYIAANIKNIRFIGDYTNEVLWGPYFMLYNWIWRHTR